MKAGDGEIRIGAGIEGAAILPEGYLVNLKRCLPEYCELTVEEMLEGHPRLGIDSGTHYYL